MARELKKGHWTIWGNEYAPGKLIITNKKTGVKVEALLETKFHEEAKIYHWRPQFDPKMKRHYIVSNPLQKLFPIHRFVLGLTDGTLHVDHINHDTLDNRTINLRAVSPRMNAWNRRDNKSGFPGVSWNKETKKWRAQLNLNGKQTHLGYFSSKEEAFRRVQEVKI